MIWAKRWPNFEPDEVLSPIGMELYKAGIVKIQPHVLDLVQAVRNELDSPIVINTGEHRLRGWRYFSENRSIKNYSEYSYHVEGVALDMSSGKYSPQEIAEISLHVGFTFVKVYSTWCHADVGFRI